MVLCCIQNWQMHRHAECTQLLEQLGIDAVASRCSRIHLPSPSCCCIHFRQGTSCLTEPRCCNQASSLDFAAVARRCDCALTLQLLYFAVTGNSVYAGDPKCRSYTGTEQRAKSRAAAVNNNCWQQEHSFFAVCASLCQREG